MANIAYSDLLEGIRGHVGSSVFSRARSGPTVRRRNTPCARPFGLRPTRNTALAGYASLWLSDLTPQERADWNTLAGNTTFTNSLGQEYHPTGQQLYIRSNTLLTLTNLAAVSSPPAAAIRTANGLHPIYHKPNGIILDPPNTWPNSENRRAIISSSPALPLSAATYYKNFTDATYYTADWPEHTFPIINDGADALLDKRLHFRGRAIDHLGAASLQIAGAVSCLDDGPTAWWLPLNDNLATNNVADYLGNFDATLFDAGGTPTTAFHSCAGPRGTGLDFDGVDDYVRRATRAWTPGDTTISFWLRHDNLPAAYSVVLEYFTANTAGLRLLIRAANPQAVLYVAKGGDWTSFNWCNENELESDRWIKLTMTTDLTDIATYVDSLQSGELLGYNPVLWPPVAPLNLGFFVGLNNTPLRLCDFRIYDRILTPAEIALI